MRARCDNLLTRDAWAEEQEAEKAARAKALAELKEERKGEVHRREEAIKTARRGRPPATANNNQFAQ